MFRENILLTKAPIKFKSWAEELEDSFEEEEENSEAETDIEDGDND